MKAEGFAALMRKGAGKLRVDRVVVSAGKTKLRGAGSLRIEQDKLKVELFLSSKSKLPERKKVWREGDFWKVSGLIEHSLRFVGTNVSPGSTSHSGDLVMVTLNLHAIELVHRRKSRKEREELRRMFDEIAARHRTSDAPLPPAEPEPEPAPKAPSVRFEAVLVDTELLAANGGTEVIRRNDFLKESSESTADTYVTRGRDYDLALIQRDTDLHVHFQSKDRYRSKTAAEDYQRFRAILNAIGFTYGFNPWPHRLQQWRDDRTVRDVFTAPRRLPKTMHAPFDQALGINSVPPPIRLVAKFFARRSPLSGKISEFLFLFRQAGDSTVHLPVRTLAFCSLFEGLVHLLFAELKLERKLRRATPDFATFLAERDRVVEELKAQGAAGNAASKRLAGLLANAEAVRVKDKYNALCEHFDLEAGQMKKHFDAWYEERNPLMHGTWRSHRDSDYVHQALIAGAINILLLKLMGYAGRVVAVRFSGERSETYRTI